MMFKHFFVGSIFDLSKRQNTIFWIGQIAMVFSTILGVYLAASTGFKTAIDFHSIVSDEKNFYTLSALRKEVKANNDVLLSFSEDNLVLNEQGEIEAHRSATVPQLNWFVWVTMSNATETLELPVDILSDTNRYYINLTKEMDAYQNSGGPDKLFAAKRLYKLVKSTETELLSRMDKQIERYYKRLSKYDNLGKY